MDNSNQLWKTQEEVDQLWYEEKHHGLWKVAEDAHHSEGHASTVAERVSDEYLWGESIVLQQSQGAKEERNHNCQRINVVLNIFLPLWSSQLLIDIDLNNVVNNDKASYDHGLANFNPINSCVDVDSVGTEYSNVAHINVVNDS